MSNEELSGLDADGSWPDWRPSPDPAHSDRDGYGHISRYVTPRLLDELGYGPGHRRDARRAGLVGPMRDLHTAQVLWNQLVAAGIAYTDAPWNPGKGQILRDPEWVLGSEIRSAGTCADLCLLFAGLCLNERLDTFLVMLRSADKAHMLVTVRLGTSAPDDAMKAKTRLAQPLIPLGTEPTGTDGVFRIHDQESLIGNEDMLFLDATSATMGEPRQTLHDSQARVLKVLSYGAYEHAHLVDIAVRQWACGDTELPRPRYRRSPAIPPQHAQPRDRNAEQPATPPHRRLTARILPSPKPLIQFPAHEEARAALRASTEGKVVVVGSPGVGKSALATWFGAQAQRPGWFLPAASRTALNTVLAEGELVERGEQPRELEAAEREALARQALERLRRDEAPWIVILDNAPTPIELDGSPFAVDKLPDPKPGQLIIATSTASPDQWPGWQVVQLPPVPDGELEGLERIALLCAGLPLLAVAFDKLLTVGPEALSTVLQKLERENNAAEAPDLARGAEIYWTAASASLARPVTALAERLAWLPPDRIESGAAGDDDEALAALCAIGLLGESAAPGAFSMHRAFGQAIRTAVTNAGRAERIVRELLDRPAARTSLLRHGDRAVATELAAALASTTSGMALWALATLQEVHVPRLAPETFARARPLLNPDDLAQAAALADCLHALVRFASQRRPTTSQELNAATEDISHAITLRTPADQAAIARHEALLALIRQREGRFIDDPAERLLLMTEVRNLLEASWLRRRAVFGDSDPLTDRGNFNRAGVMITMARESMGLANLAASAGRAAQEARYRSRAVNYLNEAGQVYRATLAFRRRYYGGPNPITAASLNGIGIWAYESVRLGLADAPNALLDEAITATTEAFSMRRATGIANDTTKSASLLAKLSLLQIKLATGTPAKPEGRLPATIEELLRELGIDPEH